MKSTRTAKSFLKGVIIILRTSIWLGVTQKTAWYLNYRIRQMLTEKAPELLEGICEVDETYIGGNESNKHASRRTVRGGAGN